MGASLRASSKPRTSTGVGGWDYRERVRPVGDDLLLPPSVRLEQGEGGLPRVVVGSPGGGSAEVYLHGAHVTAWAPPGAAPVLWMSPASRFDAAAAIRGGVPICFPWFGGGPDGDRSPAHGYARLADWRLVGAEEGPDGVVVTLALDAGDDGLAATFRVSVGRRLGLSLDVVNEGAAPTSFEVALHTYLAVADVRAIRVLGLAGERYLDRNGGPEPVRQDEEAITIAGETDRIYVGSRATVGVEDPGLGRRLVVEKEGSASTVVWNPWVGKASAMADVGPEAWRGFVCVETANVRSDAVTLARGARHVTTALIGVEEA